LKAVYKNKKTEKKRQGKLENTSDNKKARQKTPGRLLFAI